MDCSPNVTWQESRLSRARRWAALRARGATVWLTGLPSAGKSTIGAAIEELLVTQGVQAYLLDGDNLRHGFCGDLGFSGSDRRANMRRVGELARLFADSGAMAIVALVSPYEAVRREVREQHESEGLCFLEVFINTPLVVCAERDPKGLYARAYSGELDGLTGVDDVYEPPPHPDLELTPSYHVEAAAQAVLDLIATRSGDPCVPEARVWARRETPRGLRPAGAPAGQERIEGTLS
jgi:adenylyl-sulfate kinase